MTKLYSERLEVRLTEEQRSQLNYILQQTGLNSSDFFRDHIRNTYKKLKQDK